MRCLYLDIWWLYAKYGYLYWIFGYLYLKVFWSASRFHNCWLLQIMASQPTPNLPPTEIGPAIKSLFLGEDVRGGWLTSHDKLEMIALEVQNLIIDRHLFGDVFQNPLVKQGSLCHQTFKHITLRYTLGFIYLFVSVCFCYLLISVSCHLCGVWLLCLIPFLFDWSWFVQRTNLPEN